mmetsp:Transcript_21084/g.65352  ORF Transcript_21084/g.65352 Transcript_21084/m.65352 type:complete len:351 (-) Transcript_21084:421-1473(-)
MSGPICVPSASPAPTLMPAVASVSRLQNSSYSDACTKTRLTLTHTWPAFLNLMLMQPATAASRSASSKTSSGALPPSSRLTFFTVSAHWRISSLPTAVDPVKVSLRTSLEAHSTPPMAGASPMTQLSTPGGTPARSASSISARQHSGVSSDGLMTTVQPTASAGAHFRVIIAMGKFHGVMAPTTPTGCLRLTMRRPPTGLCRTSPVTRRPSSANHSTKEAPYATSPRASASGLPCSAVMMRARSSPFSTIRSCHRRRIAPRCLAGSAAQGEKAALAAATARAASTAPLLGTHASASPVAGSTTSSVPSSPDVSHAPPMRVRALSSDGSRNVEPSVGPGRYRSTIKNSITV